jgi:energy-coupling factor transporter ATP-binding protein EcfA2
VDFYNIVVNEEKDGTLKVRPDWKVGRSSDLMTRGGQFYAIWDEEAQLWSTDIYDVQRLVDADLQKFKEKVEARTGRIYQVMRLQSHGSRLWDDFQRFIRNSGNNSHGLNETLVFANTDVKKDDYASLRLDYDLREGDHSAWDHILGTLYSVEERAKIEWAIGAVVSGDSKAIQKFLVFYGPPGSGKSTILNIIERLFRGYTGIFDARELAGNNNSFATSAFKNNPLVAIQQDGDLSRIFDNTKLNSIVAHETMIINEKYKAPHEARSNAFLFMGTNLPVKITDAKSGLIRRLIDVIPTGQQIEHELYHRLMDQINFELGAIAFHCLQEYRKMGRNFYSKYQPKSMMLKTDEFYNFVEAHFGIFKRQQGITLKQAYTLYKEYCSETGIDKVLPMYKFREELREYFFMFQERTRVDGKEVRNYYSGFKNLSPDPPEAEVPVKVDGPYEIVLEDMSSIFDDLFAGQPAQYADEVGNPRRKWVNVDTTLADLDTKELHWVKVPENLIVIDFDIRNEAGEKDLALNLAAASKWPATYTETSQGGQGIHLHYTYLGDVEMLANTYDDGIEIKTLLGGAALRRKLTRCNNVTITPLQEGLPKKEKPTLSEQTMKSEKGLRDLLEANLAKKYHPGTKPSIDFIKKILDDAYESNMAYDVSDMRGRILTFAFAQHEPGRYLRQDRSDHEVQERQRYSGARRDSIQRCCR